MKTKWEDIPEIVRVLAYNHGAFLVGSQATRFARGAGPDPSKDWDLFVPHENWRNAAMRLPLTAKPNGNRGWRFQPPGLAQEVKMSVPNRHSIKLSVSTGVWVDVWPDELARFLTEAVSVNHVSARPGPQYAVSLRDGLVFRASEKATL